MPTNSAIHWQGYVVAYDVWFRFGDKEIVELIRRSQNLLGAFHQAFAQFALASQSHGVTQGHSPQF
jgi:hypothetical protein